MYVCLYCSKYKILLIIFQYYLLHVFHCYLLSLYNMCDDILQENLLDRHEFLKWLVEEEFIKVTDNRVLQLYLPLVLTVSQNTLPSVPTFRFLSK